jgi:hypothetical protein
MGYCHYYRQLRSFNDTEWAVISKDVAAILTFATTEEGVVIGNADGRLVKSVSLCIGAETIMFNGVEPNECEPVEIYKTLQKLWPLGEPGRNFVKTRRLPYDLVATAVLAYLGSTGRYEVSSDGKGGAWLAGVALAKAALPALRETIDIPRPILEADRWCPPAVSVFTDDYEFRFCVNGKAYITRESDGASYAFPDFRSAAEMVMAHQDLLNPRGLIDQKRRSALAADQNALFEAKILSAVAEGRDETPPAFVRPDEYPDRIMLPTTIEDAIARSAIATS